MAIKKHDSSTRVLTFVLTIAFGLVAAVIAYATFNGGSFDLRSKAATEEIILKQWTFNTNAEGWQAKDFLSSAVSGGIYTLTVHPTYKQECTTQGKGRTARQICKQVRAMRELTPQIFNTSVATNLMYPVNKFRIRLAVLAPKATAGRPPTGENGKTVSFQSPQAVYPFTIKVTQKYQGKKLSDADQQISAIADGKEHEYSFEFSRALNLKRVDELQIQFVSLPRDANTVVSINDIALIGMKEVRPTISKVPPSRTPIQCGSGVKTFAPGKSITCSGDYYLGMSYTCFDGYSGVVDEGTKCISYEVLKQKVTTLCSGRLNCPETSIAPITPTGYPSQYPKPTPYRLPIVSQYPTYPTATPPPYTSTTPVQ